MDKRNQILGILLSVSLLLILVAAVFPIMQVRWVGSKYLFAVGAAGALVCRILEKHPKSGLRVRRLHRMEVVSALCYCLSAFFMFYADTVSDWLAFLTAGAVLQLYTAFMLPRAERQELEANKK